MNFPIVKEYKFDIDGSNPENLVTDELEILGSGMLSRIYVPRHSPFFVDSLSLTDGKGEPLIKGKHYQIYKLMGKLTEFTGYPVSCLIELIDDGITEVKSTYQTVGSLSLFDNGLISLILDAVNDNRPVMFENITNRPLGFPPKLHGHSLLYEINSFQDSVDFVEELIVYLTKQKSSAIEVKLDAAYDTIKFYIALYTERVQKMMDRHSEAYNAHGITATQVKLEKVNNHATASLQQTLDGDRDDLLITPPGVGSFIKEYGFNADDFIEINKIPMSHYGNKNFIPPSIDGSFEGIGSDSECTGFCLEKDGTLMMLRNHFDGRTEGLYYSFMKDYKVDRPEFVFTGYKYQNQRIIGDGVKVTRIVQGSNENVLMVGERFTNNWYIGLTHGTFDFNKHVMTKIDMSEMIATLTPETTETVFNDEYKLAVHYFGKWTYILMSIDSDKDGDFGSGSRIFFFRALSSDIALGGTVKFSRINVSFDTVEGESYTGRPYLRPWSRVVIPGTNNCTRSYWNLVPYSTTGGVAGWKPLSLSSYDETGATPAIIRLMYYMQPNYVQDDKVVQLEIRPVVVYRFDAEQGRLVMQAKTPVETINYLTMSQQQINDIRDKHTVGGPWIRQNGGKNPGFGALPTGELIAEQQPGNAAYPASFTLFNYFKTRKYDVVGLIPSVGIAQEPKARYSDGLIRSPLVNNSKPTSMGFDGSNEIMNGQNQDFRTKFQFYFYRTVTGGYAEREGVTNVSFPLKSRPLVNTVYHTDVPKNTPFINFTGDDATLSASGMEMGRLSFSMGMNVNGVGSPEWFFGGVPYDIKKDGVAMTYPRGHVFADDTNELLGKYKKLTISDYYGMNQATIDKIYTMVPAKYRSKTMHFTISHIDNTGNIYKGEPFGIVSLTWDVPELGQVHTQLFTLRFVMEAKGGTHPNVQLVKDFTVVHNTGIHEMVAAQTGIVPNMASGDRTGAMQVYRAGNRMRIGFYNPILNRTVGDNTGTSWLYDVDLTTFQFSNVESESASWFAGGRGSNYVGIPRVGVGRYMSGDECGFAGLIAYTAAGDHYLMSSIYPETGWIVYFQLPQRVIIYGYEYELPPGTIDLRDINSSPGNKTFYIYVNYKDKKVNYEISTNKMADSTFHIWIGTVITNERQILTINRQNVFLINSSRVSEQKRGSSIPASSGNILGDGQIAWVHDSELIG